MFNIEKDLSLFREKDTNFTSHTNSDRLNIIADCISKHAILDDPARIFIS